MLICLKHCCSSRSEKKKEKKKKELNSSKIPIPHNLGEKKALFFVHEVYGESHHRKSNSQGKNLGEAKREHLKINEVLIAEK